MANILTEVYEVRFCDSSYGYRPERSAHDAMKYQHIDVVKRCQKIFFILK